jgi:hypothetical protein
MSFCAAVTCRASSSSGGPVEGDDQCPHEGCCGPRGYFAGLGRSYAGDPVRKGDHGSLGGKGGDLLGEEVGGRRAEGEGCG